TLTRSRPRPTRWVSSSAPVFGRRTRLPVSGCPGCSSLAPSLCRCVCRRRLLRRWRTRSAVAATLQARRLTEAHRLAQARTGAQAVAALRSIWQLLDPEDLDGTVGRWLQAAIPVVAQMRTLSA